jgi:hypothetical protein
MKNPLVILGLCLAPAGAIAQTVEITPLRAYAIVGDTVRFKAVLKDPNGQVIDTARIVWRAAPFDVAWARPDGAILPVRQGEVQVLAIAGGKVARATLTVGPKPPASLYLESASPTVVVGGLLAIRATARTSDGENLREARVLFRTSDERIATIDAAGVLAARTPGAVTILARNRPGARAVAPAGRAQPRGSPGSEGSQFDTHG